MARQDEPQPLLPSLLDRLLDDEPAVTREPPRGRGQALRDLKQAVRRDLEILLNTRRSFLDWPPALAELQRSLLNYGLPDFSATGLGSARERHDFCRTLQELLERSEPRLKAVSVRPLDNALGLGRTLRFRIDALLRTDPAPEPIVFDSMLEPSSAAFTVKGVEG
jgi:type VI secretion system protein ImpF